MTETNGILFLPSGRWRWRVEDTVEKWHPPGISVAVRPRDGRVLTVVDGVERVDEQTPVKENSVFGAGSISKSFVAAAMLRLIEEGRVGLDDSTEEWLPDVPSSNKITIRHLLTHTSGLGWDAGSWDDWYSEIVRRPGTAITDQREPRLVGEPGHSFRYENSNYELLAKIIERVSNERLGSVIRARFLDPLELDRTYVQPDERPRPPITHGYDRPSVHDYEWPGARSLDVDVSEGGKGYVPSLSITSTLRAAGGMASTPTDLALWARAVWGGDALKRSSRAAMLSVSAPSTKQHEPPGFDGYGLGVVRTRFDGGRVLWSHGGGTTGFRAFAGYLPHLDLSFAVMVNTSRDDFIVGELVQAILQDFDIDAPTPIIA
jgi:D-alanyl-D-alanine carboxypeptidase